jgi:hypothetical protein
MRENYKLLSIHLFQFIHHCTFGNEFTIHEQPAIVCNIYNRQPCSPSREPYARGSSALRKPLSWCHQQQCCTSNTTSGGRQQPCFPSREPYARGSTAAYSSPRHPQEVIDSPVPHRENPTPGSRQH